MSAPRVMAQPAPPGRPVPSVTRDARGIRPATAGVRVGSYLVDLGLALAAAALTWPLAGSWLVAVVVATEAGIALSLARAATGRTPGAVLTHSVAHVRGGDRAPGLRRQGLRSLITGALHLTAVGPLVTAATARPGQDWVDRLAGTAVTVLGPGGPGGSAGGSVATAPGGSADGRQAGPIPTPGPRSTVEPAGPGAVRGPGLRPGEQQRGNEPARREPWPAQQRTQPVDLARPPVGGPPGQFPGAGRALPTPSAPPPVGEALPGTPAAGPGATRPAPSGLPADQRPAATSRPAPPTRPDPRPPLTPSARPSVPAAPSAPSLPRLWAVLDNGQRIELGGVSVLGRDPGSNEVTETVVAISDPTRSLSRTHLRIGYDDTGLWLQDTFSANGTGYRTADGHTVELVPGRRVHVAPGTVVLLGDRSLTLRSEG